MANLPDVFENAVLDYVTKAVTPAAVTGPIRVRLLSALGTADAAGTPITGGTTPALDYGAVANTQVSEGAQTSNGAVRRYEGLPNPTTVAGFQLIDSAATPVVTMDNIPRSGGSVSVTDGIFEIPAGGLTANSK
jgi:hypothetical protein